MNDTIYRQAAIDAVMDTKPIVFDVNRLEPHQRTKAVVKALEQLPSAQQDNSCDGCKYENANDGVLVPCGFCKRSHPDNYERKTDG